MKKILLILSAVALVGYGCNKNDEKGSAAGTGVQEETAVPADTSVGSGATSPTSDTTDTDMVPTERTDSTMDTQSTDPQRMESPSDVGTGSMEDDEMIDDRMEDVNRGLDKNDQMEDQQ